MVTKTVPTRTSISDVAIFVRTFWDTHTHTHTHLAYCNT